MIEGGRPLTFAQQPCGFDGIAMDSWRHPLDRDRSSQFGVFGAVDFAHAAGTETGQNVEATDRGARQVLRRSRRSPDSIVYVRHGEAESPLAKH
jgi:hypothetical protein